MQLKAQIEKNNPEAKIKIIDRYIYVQSDFDLSLYIIQDGEILPAKISKHEPLKIEFQNEKNQLIPVKQKKPTILSKFTTGIRQIFSKNKNTNIPVIVNSNNYIKNSEFRESFKFESETRETEIQQKPDTNIQQKQNEGR